VSTTVVQVLDLWKAKVCSSCSFGRIESSSQNVMPQTDVIDEAISQVSSGADVLRQPLPASMPAQPDAFPFHVKAKYPLQTQRPDELSLVFNEILTVNSQVNADWSAYQ
jgi:hypothetical protein